MSTAKPVKFPRTINGMSAVFFGSAKLVHYLEDHPRTDVPRPGANGHKHGLHFWGDPITTYPIPGRYHPLCIRSPAKSGWIFMESPEFLPKMVTMGGFTPAQKIKIKETSPNATERM